MYPKLNHCKNDGIYVGSTTMDDVLTHFLPPSLPPENWHMILAKCGKIK